MFKKVALTVSAVAFIMLAIALAPNVPTALATVRATISDAKSSPSASEHPCAAFEVWFLMPVAGQAMSRKLRERSNT